MDIGEGEPLFGNFEYEALQARAKNGLSRLIQLKPMAFMVFGHCQL